MEGITAGIVLSRLEQDKKEISNGTESVIAAISMMRLAHMRFL
jgi:hypothetical protein